MRMVSIFGWKALVFLLAILLVVFFFIVLLFKLFVFLLPVIIIIVLFFFIVWLFKHQVLNRVYKKRKPKSKTIDVKFKVKN